MNEQQSEHIGICCLLEDLQNILNELEDRIKPILAPAHEVVGKDEAKAPSCSSVQGDVQSMSDQVRTMVNRVQL